MTSESLLAILAPFGSLLMFAALLIMWLRFRSPWLLAAVIIDSLLVLFNLFARVLPLGEYPILIQVWQLCGLLGSVCLLGFALSLKPAKA